MIPIGLETVLNYRNRLYQSTFCDCSRAYQFVSLNSRPFVLVCVALISISMTFNKAMSVSSVVRSLCVIMVAEYKRVI